MNCTNRNQTAGTCILGFLSGKLMKVQVAYKETSMKFFFLVWRVLNKWCYASHYIQFERFFNVSLSVPMIFCLGDQTDDTSVTQLLYARLSLRPCPVHWVTARLDLVWPLTTPIPRLYKLTNSVSLTGFAPCAIPTGNLVVSFWQLKYSVIPIWLTQRRDMKLFSCKKTENQSHHNQSLISCGHCVRRKWDY